jgi:hypothetical protein
MTTTNRKPVQTEIFTLIVDGGLTSERRYEFDDRHEAEAAFEDEAEAQGEYERVELFEAPAGEVLPGDLDPIRFVATYL